MPTQEASAKSMNEKTRKGKGKATIKDTRDQDACPICMQWYQKLGFTMGDWIECHCKQWIHEDCIDYNLMNHLSVQDVYNSIYDEFCSVPYAF